MKKLAISVLFDTAFAICVTFIVLFVIFYYYLPLSYSFVFAIIFACIVGIFTFYRLKSKRIKAGYKKDEQQLKDKIITQLCFMPAQKQLTEISKAYMLTGAKLNRLPNGIVVDNKMVIVPFFTFNVVTQQDLLDIKRKVKSNLPITVFGVNFDDSAKNFALKLNVTLKTETDVYELFKSVNYYPEIKIELNSSKQSVKLLLREFLSKRNVKNYFLTGIMLLILAFFTPFKFYYVSFGCVLLIFAIFVKFSKS